ncbi:hypothetical protein [Streptomyces anulatus]|uniref:hypothetical protein n=1 Tax=Streptomyces anulatus TaxID=1892 RepID=UPI003657275A
MTILGLAADRRTIHDSIAAGLLDWPPPADRAAAIDEATALWATAGTNPALVRAGLLRAGPHPAGAAPPKGPFGKAEQVLMSRV